MLGEIENAEPYYHAAIALAEELGMRPLLARAHQGISRLYARAGDRERAAAHELAATQVLDAMNINRRGGGSCR